MPVPAAPLTVSQLTFQIKQQLEASFPQVAVLGEISNCSIASSGHVYLTLKDRHAQIRAVMWRSAAARLKFELEDGLEVVAVGEIEVYEPRGTYQLMIQSLWPQGVGALELAFRQLHDRLGAEGLFAADRKRPLPRLPRRIAIVTSPTGAAVRDLLQVMTRRWPRCDLVLLPVAVQGTGAAAQIAAAIRYAPAIPGVDLIITGRGGGSLEDLWAFNEEVVARAVHASPVPVISAVGHETDITICDLVADRRALTPSEAGELAVPAREEILLQLGQWQNRLGGALRNRLERAREMVERLEEHRVFRKPLERIHLAQRELDELEHRARRGLQRHLERAKQSLATVAGRLEALSPLRVLARGYSVTRTAGGELVRQPGQVQPGDLITTQLPGGRIQSRIE